MPRSFSYGLLEEHHVFRNLIMLRLFIACFTLFFVRFGDGEQLENCINRSRNEGPVWRHRADDRSEH